MSLALILDAIIASVSLAVTLVYVGLQYHEYRENRSDLRHKCAQAVVCEAFQRFMQPTIALRFEGLIAHHDDFRSPCCTNKRHPVDILDCVGTLGHLSQALQMTPQDMREMVLMADVIWETEGYKPTCPSRLRHKLLTCAMQALHGVHVEQLIKSAMTFVQAERFSRACAHGLPLVGMASWPACAAERDPV